MNLTHTYQHPRFHHTRTYFFILYFKNKDKPALIVSIGSFLFFTYTQITQTLVSIFNTDLGSFTHTLYCLSFGSIVFFLYCYASYKLIRSKSVLTKTKRVFFIVSLCLMFLVSSKLIVKTLTSLHETKYTSGPHIKTKPIEQDTFQVKTSLTKLSQCLPYNFRWLRK